MVTSYPGKQRQNNKQEDQGNQLPWQIEAKKKKQDEKTQNIIQKELQIIIFKNKKNAKMSSLYSISGYEISHTVDEIVVCRLSRIQDEFEQWYEKR